MKKILIEERFPHQTLEKRAEQRETSTVSTLDGPYAPLPELLTGDRKMKRSKIPQKPLACSFKLTSDPWKTLRSKPGITIMSISEKKP